MKVDIEKLRSLEEQKLLGSQKHPEHDLLIWNYTPRCAFEKAWTEETLMCRGLVTDLEGNIVARPFRKFFNLEEHQGELPAQEPVVYEKMDGSLGIVFWYKNRWIITTRGSFVSEQAIKGAELLERYSRNDDGTYNPILPVYYTHLFEILFPENRIVVDYGAQSKLVYLASIDPETGTELRFEDVEWPHKASVYGFTIEGVKQIKDWQNAEGFVLRWPDGLRLKLKFDEYKRLHRIVTGVSNIAIWEMMRDRQPLDEILDRVPDEFYQWVRKTRDDLQHTYDVIKSEMQTLIEHYQKHGPISRKEMARRILEDDRWPSVAFTLLDGRDPHAAIMRIIRPKFSKPFKVDET